MRTVAVIVFLIVGLVISSSMNVVLPMLWSMYLLKHSEVSVRKITRKAFYSKQSVNPEPRLSVTMSTITSWAAWISRKLCTFFCIIGSVLSGLYTYILTRAVVRDWVSRRCST